MTKDITYLAETTFRNEKKKFGIKLDDRRRHIYIVGKTGMGKTVLLENMAIQDIQNGKGICFVDPHGEAAERLLDFIPSNRINDVVYFNPSDIDYPIAFNIMEEVLPQYRYLVASGLMGVFKKIWPDVWSARMEYILNNCILALLEYPGSTLLGVNRMLADIDYRKKVIEKITDPVIKSFWVNEFARYTQQYEIEATAAIQNKIGQLTSSSVIRNIIGQPKSMINIREIMDKKKILILNLSKGRIGEDNSKLLGALLITKIQLTAMSRVDIPEEERQDFFLYVDEFQNFATESFVNILSEARKYRLSLTLGHQYITQMEERVRDAVFGNIGTLISFRVGAEDSIYLEKEFSPEFIANDLVNLAKYNIYLKLMIDGIAGRPFSAKTLKPSPLLEKSFKKEIIKISREKYGVPRQIVEKKIAQWIGDLKLVELYDAQCSICNKPCKVVFKPDSKRSIYCKSCREKLKKTKETKETKEESSVNSISLKEAVKKQPLPFVLPKEKQLKIKAPKKEVDVKELRKQIKEALDKPLEQANPVRKNEVAGLSNGAKETEKKTDSISSKTRKEIIIIKPGEIVKFNANNKRF